MLTPKMELLVKQTCNDRVQEEETKCQIFGLMCGVGHLWSFAGGLWSFVVICSRLLVVCGRCLFY